MFCGKCGAQNADNAEFCAQCGEKLKKITPTATETETISVPNQNDKNRKVGMIAVAVAIVAVIIICVTLFGGRGYKSTVKKFIDAMNDADAEAMVELMPEGVVDYALEQSGYYSDDLDYLIEVLDESLEDTMDSLDSYLGEDWEISYEILDTDNIKGDDLDTLKDEYEEFDVKVSAAKDVEIKLTVKADETESSNSINLTLIKVGRSWYLEVMSMEDLF